MQQEQHHHQQQHQQQQLSTISTRKHNIDAANRTTESAAIAATII
jgi:hypothetical protein